MALLPEKITIYREFRQTRRGLCYPVERLPGTETREE